MTLENKLNISDAVELARAEEKISKTKALKLFTSGYLNTLEAGTFDSLAEIHRYLFDEIYSFAGNVRTVNMAKGNFRFAPVMYLEQALKHIEAMPQSTYNEIIEKYVEMNIAHPFREGNGRSQRLFIESLAKINGIYLDLTEVTKEDMIIASHESIKGNYHKLKEIFIKYSYALDDKEKLKYISDYCSDELKKIILNNK